MRIHRIMIAAAVVFAVVQTCNAFDSIKTMKSTLIGRVASISPLEVELEGVGGASQKVPVNEIQTIFLDTDPSELRTAKTHVLGGRYADAMAALERIKKEDAARPENKPDIDFYKALCASRLAMSGKGSLEDAGRMMVEFVDANPKSYHYFEAAETVGDLLVAVQQYAKAAEYYARLENAPWPDYKMRAGVATGRALLAQGKAREAESAFDRVIGSLAEGELAQSQRLAARLGKASALTATQKPDAAIQMVEEVLSTADPEDAPMMARAYNALGTAYRQAGRTKDALLAFLHVDILYASQPEAHAEALANLVDLWESVHKSERANAARRTLDEQYRDSPWARKNGG